MRKAVELTSGDLPFVRDFGLRIGQPVLTGRQKSAEGVVGTEVLKARTVLTLGRRLRQTYRSISRPARLRSWSRG